MPRKKVVLHRGFHREQRYAFHKGLIFDLWHYQERSPFTGELYPPGEGNEWWIDVYEEMPGDRDMIEAIGFDEFKQKILHERRFHEHGYVGWWGAVYLKDARKIVQEFKV